jgi:CheY-like chemotaxis protein
MLLAELSDHYAGVMPEDGIRSTWRIPAMAVTAHARAEDCALALRVAFQEYVPKPVEHQRLIRAVRELALKPTSR